MGCYLSAPDNKVYVTEGQASNFKYATASCQGWRREQEDAEACIPSFDTNASLFILCDGHGGSEVAKYTVEHFPNFLKNHQLYKEGKYEEALRQAFIDFDALLRSEEVFHELSKLAADGSEKAESEKGSDKEANADNGSKILDLNNSENDLNKAGSSNSDPEPSTSNDRKGPNSIVEDVDGETLRKEARIPLKKILGGYSSKRLWGGTFASPVVKSNKGEDDDEAGENKMSCLDEDDQPQASSSKANNEVEASSSKGPESMKENLIRQVLQRYFPDEEGSEDDSDYDASVAEDDEDGDDEGEDEENATKKRKRKKHKLTKEEPLLTGTEDEDDDDDSDDDGDEDEEDSEDDQDGDDDESGDDDEEDDDDDEDEQEDEDDDGYPSLDEEVIMDEDRWKEIHLKVKGGGSPKLHRPAVDSGCTVVVALVKDDKIYVASAGDSRCILIMRSGECKPMSFDHKPEDVAEHTRIVSAGGRVIDGRVNSGLNLSRAFGDFSYKNSDLPAEKQMITPCPDINVADLNVEELEYIFLACDGIWNSMTNSKTSKFIRKVANHSKNNLVEMCLQLFRACIAPGTDGDGTGCDNMTCIIARFDKQISAQQKEQDQPLNNQDLSDKMNEESRPSPPLKRSPSNEDSGELPSKRRCLSL